MPPGALIQDPNAGWLPKPPPISPTNQFGNPNTFTAAANTQAGDYDRIMQQYADLAKSYSDNPLSVAPLTAQQTSKQAPISAPTVSFNSITPQTAKYEQSNDVTNSLAKLSDLATTGGYDSAGIADLRARGVAPTRSIYANAQENVNRQRALAGGYSPSFNATQAKLARDESSQIGDITTNVNAGIAQNVATNRIAAASPYASASASANAEKARADQANAAIINQINEANSQGNFAASSANANLGLGAKEFNTSTDAAISEANANRVNSTSQFNTDAALRAAMANRGGQLGAIQGQASLYGTTPALTNTFGNQVIQAGQLGQGQQQLNNQKIGTISGISQRFGA